MTNPTLVQGDIRPLISGGVYEKTTSDVEKVNKILLVRGTAATQLKIAGADGDVIAIGMPQDVPAYVTSTKQWDSDYQADGEYIYHQAYHSAEILNGTLSASQTIVPEDELMVIAGGLLAKATSGHVVVAIAQEGVTTGAGETADIKIRPIDPKTGRTLA